jgi:hypothetical protein
VLVEPDAPLPGTPLDNERAVGKVGLRAAGWERGSLGAREAVARGIWYLSIPPVPGSAAD